MFCENFAFNVNKHSDIIPHYFFLNSSNENILCFKKHSKEKKQEYRNQEINKHLFIFSKNFPAVLGDVC